MTRNLFVVALFIIFGFSVPLYLKAQTCTKSTQTDICLTLVPNSNVLPSLPQALQVRNHEQVTFHLSNVSPLEQCKLAGITVTPEPPASALQGAVTAIMGMAPFGIGGLLNNVPSTETTTRALFLGKGVFDEYIRQAPVKQVEKDPIAEAIAKQKDVIQKAQNLLALQVGKQQDGVAIAAMYSNFMVSDFRNKGSFQPAYTALSGALADNLKYAPPGEQAADGAATNRRVTTANSGGLLSDVIPVSDPAPGNVPIVDLQSELDQAKSLIGTAHAIYDKDPKKLATLVDSYATSDRYQSVAAQLLAAITANDTALKTQQTSLMTLKLSVDQLKKTAFDGASPKESVNLPVSRFKNGKVTGNITCVNRLDNSKVTLDPMPYSVDFQLVPLLAFSTGVLFSPIEKQIFGTKTVEDTSAPPPSAPTPVPTLNKVAITDSASFQAVPFSFLSLRLLPGWSYRTQPVTDAGKTLYDRCPKLARYLSRHVFTGGITGGFGVNPNGGTTSPEYFAGAFGSVDRFMLHFGLDEGRVQTLSGQFNLGDIVPPSTTIPTDHHFVGKASAAISVRLYP